MKSKWSKQVALLFFILVQINRATAQLLYPAESRPDIFTFFTPGLSATNPANSDMISKGVAFLSTPNGDGDGTSFIIRTFRDDNKVCMCLTGHQIVDYTQRIDRSGNRIALVNSDIRMNYLGADSLNNGINYTSIRNFSKSYIRQATVLEVPASPHNTVDAALILVDQNNLPADEYAMLGYSFEDAYWDRPEYWYSIGHSHGYPQRIVDNATYTDQFANSPAYLTLLSPKPYAIAEGASGSPVMIRLNTVATPVKAILSEGTYDRAYTGSFYSHFNWGWWPRRFDFFTKFSATKISVLEQAIRKHCWKKNDSAAISTSQSYRQTILVDNRASSNPYQQNTSLTSAIPLTTPSVALFQESLPECRTSRLHANTCDMAGFVLPTTYPGDNQDWQVTVSAKQINVGNDFNYTASGNSELELSTVVFFTNTAVSSAARRTEDIPSTANGNKRDQRFNVYPNPSPDGIFNIILPVTGQFNVTVSTLDGKNVYQSNCTANPFQVSLANRARGSYVLNVYDAQLNNKVIFTELIIY